jgi:hypothetical protein
LIFGLGYLAILFLAKKRRDQLGFALVLCFCLILGQRDITQLTLDTDPVIYAAILSSDLDMRDVAGGPDYALFGLLHPFTGKYLSLTFCFFLLHLLYIPFLYLLFRLTRGFKGTFFLMAGWMLFVNSGLLLLANFFRQGLGVLLFLSVLCGFAISNRQFWLKTGGMLALPFLHFSSTGLLPFLLACRRRRYYLIACVFFTLFCLAIRFGPASAIGHAGYFENDDQGMKMQMIVKIFAIYAMLAAGRWLRSTPESASESGNIQRAAVGFLIPTGALLLTLNAPIVGLRYLYYSYAAAFLYLALIISARNRESLTRLSAIGMCGFGFVTWTYPTVAKLLFW